MTDKLPKVTCPRSLRVILKLANTELRAGGPAAELTHLVTTLHCQKSNVY